jgi:hypothetical protein
MNKSKLKAESDITKHNAPNEQHILGQVHSIFLLNMSSLDTARQSIKNNNDIYIGTIPFNT